MTERTKIGPGMYAVGRELHLDAIEFCREQGYPPTPANQAVAQQAMEQIAREQGIEVEVRDRARMPPA